MKRNLSTLYVENPNAKRMRISYNSNYYKYNALKEQWDKLQAEKARFTTEMQNEREKLSLERHALNNEREQFNFLVDKRVRDAIACLESEWFAKRPTPSYYC
jgi:hypothetical protein